MRLSIWLRCFLLCGVFFPGDGAFASDMRDEVVSISVIADSDLALPMTNIIRAYTNDKHRAVSVSYQPIAQQEVEVMEGATYDVLVTARMRLVDNLKLKGLVDIYSEATVARNRLVLIADKNNSFQASLASGFPLAEFIRVFNWQPGLVIGNPETQPSGSVAREALRSYGVLEDMEQYTLYEKEWRQIIRMVQDESKLALVFQSDVHAADNLRIVDYVADKYYAPVVYVAVVLAGDKMDEARQFVDYLKQVQAQQSFEAYGFMKP